jgi:rubrerythrin
MSDPLDEVADLLIENELTIARLYEQFAQTFEEDATFWQRLAKEEHQHARWIEEARDLARTRPVEPTAPAVRLPAVEHMIQYVDSIGERCRKGELTRLNAHALARDVEDSLLESRIFNLFVPARDQLRALQERLVRDTAAHRQRIAEALDRIRKAG